MKIRLLLFFLLAHILLSAQGGYNRKYALANSLSSVCYKAVEMPNGNIIMFGLTYDTLNNQAFNRLTLVATDPAGNIVWRKDYGDSKFEYLNWINPRSIIKKDNSFYFVIVARDSTNKQVGALLNFDFNGDTLWQKIYRDPTDDLIPCGLTQTVDGGFLFTGFFQDWVNHTSQVMLIKTNLQGNELWRKRINKNVPNVHDGRAIIQDSVSKKIILVGYQYIGTASNFDAFSNIMILDSLGNKLLQTTFNNFGGGAFNELIQLKDSNFLTCGSTNANSDIGVLTRYRSMVVKFDIQGNIIWSKEFDTISPFNRMSWMHELPDGDILMTGSLDTMINHNIEDITRVKLIKIDKDGNLKWWKYIGSARDHASSEMPTSINPTQDKGFLITTWFTNLVPRPYSVIKVDSLGCDTLEAYCKSVLLGTKKYSTGYSFDLELYPMPVRNEVTMHLNSEVYDSFLVYINDVTGKIIESLRIEANKELHVNTSTYNKGVYFVSVMRGTDRVVTKKMVVD
jgi:hypothetical protein